MELEQKLLVSSSPHLRSKKATDDIMFDVLVALFPAAAAGAFFFGVRAVAVIFVSIFSCVFFEWFWQKLTKKKITISDYSAAVTGLLLALNLPPTIPLWMVVIGAAFAIIIVKQLFGGIGYNFMNPALAARAFMLASWAGEMTKWAVPGSDIPLFGAADAVTGPTPLAILKHPSVGSLPSYFDMFIGNIGGCIGETSALCILIGATYLLCRGVINYRIPLSFILTVAVMTYVFSPRGWFSGDVLANILSGGLLLGAFFMATDYSTSPVTAKGQWIMGIGCGLITSIIRLWSGAYPEGVSYSILLMNVLTPIIDKYTMPRVYGHGKREAAAQ